MKYTIIAIMGKSGAGKDSLCHALLKEPQFKDAKPIISCTTRPIRDNEQNGIDYHFLTNEQFTDLVLANKMLEATVFNDWCYGTCIDSLISPGINIGVFNPEGCEALRQHNDIELCLIYVEASDKTRLLRSLNREKDPDCHEIVRRFGADEMDFCEEEIEYLEPDIFVTNNEGASIEKISKSIAQAWASGQMKLKN
jgi:guanylate kinase